MCYDNFCTTKSRIKAVKFGILSLPFGVAVTRLFNVFSHILKCRTSRGIARSSIDRYILIIVRNKWHTIIDLYIISNQGSCGFYFCLRRLLVHESWAMDDMKSCKDQRTLLLFVNCFANSTWPSIFSVLNIGFIQFIPNGVLLKLTIGLIKWWL